MYDELIKGLRICESGDKCDFCPKWLDKQNGGLNACTSALSKDAADAIEELKKDLKRGHNYYEFWRHKAEQGLKMLQVAISNIPCWIPVTERLPLGNNLVLAVANDEVVIAIYGNYKWAEAKTYAVIYPTHWMPLPEPPESEDE